MRTFIFLVLLTSCTPDVVAPPEAPAPVAPAEQVAVAPMLGVITSLDTQVVSARIEGHIVQVAATSGKTVHKDDVLAELDPKPLDDRLRAATAAGEAAEADDQAAKADVLEQERLLSLERKMFLAGASSAEAVRVAAAKLVRSKASAERAAAALREANANRDAVDEQRSYTKLRAPIDGVVSLVKVQTGQEVTPGVAIGRVFDPSKLMSRFQVTHEHQGEIAVDQIVELTIAGTNRKLKAKVTSVSADLEPPLDFAIADAAILDPGAAKDVMVGTHVDVRLATN